MDQGGVLAETTSRSPETSNAGQRGDEGGREGCRARQLEGSRRLEAGLGTPVWVRGGADLGQGQVPAGRVPGASPLPWTSLASLGSPGAGGGELGRDWRLCPLPPPSSDTKFPSSWVGLIQSAHPS